MTRSETERLRDIKDAVTAIREHLAGTDASNPLLHDAVLYRFVIIGEAVKSLSPETRAAAPDVPWSAVARLRDLIAHAYYRVDMRRVLTIVENDLASLEAAVDGMLRERA